MSLSKPLPRRRDPRRLIRTYLRTGTRSCAEARGYLQDRGVAPADAGRMVRELERAGVLNDRACAILWARRLADAGYAWPVIRERLRDKQLAERLIDDCRERTTTESSPDGRLRAIATARLAHVPASDPRRRARLACWLASRGFDSDLISQVLAELIPEPNSHVD